MGSSQPFLRCDFSLFAPDGKTIAMVDEKREIRFCDPLSGKVSWKIENNSIGEIASILVQARPERHHRFEHNGQ